MELPEKLGKEELLEFFYELDKRLQLMNYSRKLSLYVVGGSWLSLLMPYRFTKDIDFIISQRDFIAMSSTIAEIQQKAQFQIDVFPDGELPGYSYKEFSHFAEKVPLQYKSLNIFHVDRTAFVLLKVLAGRDKDHHDIDKVIEREGKPQLEELLARFNTLKFSVSREQEFKNKFSTFLSSHYEGYA